jgi:Protein tyrosine phosphatase-like protein, PTPLA
VRLRLSRPSPTAIQVASRLWVLWGIVDLAPDETAVRTVYLFNSAFRFGLNFWTLVVAWAATEVIRYGYFSFKARARPHPAAMMGMNRPQLVLFGARASGHWTTCGGRS